MSQRITPDEAWPSHEGHKISFARTVIQHCYIDSMQVYTDGTLEDEDVEVHDYDIIENDGTPTATTAKRTWSGRSRNLKRRT